MLVLYFNPIAAYLADMITKKYTTPDIQALAEQVFYRTGERVIAQQRDILKAHYRRKSGKLAGNLSSRPFSVMRTAAGARLLINYLIRIRFLDLKLTKRGRVKDRYYPIYNKPLYGFVYGYAYGALRWGLTSNIKDNLGQGLRAALNDN